MNKKYKVGRGGNRKTEAVAACSSPSPKPLVQEAASRTLINQHPGGFTAFDAQTQRLPLLSTNVFIAIQVFLLKWSSMQNPQEQGKACKTNTPHGFVQRFQWGLAHELNLNGRRYFVFVFVFLKKPLWVICTDEENLHIQCKL